MSREVSFSATLDLVLTCVRPYQWYAFSIPVAYVAIWALSQLGRFCKFRRTASTTQLRGPTSESFLYGVGKRIMDADDPGAVYEAWAQEYGPVYMVPSTLGKKRIVLCDPKAIAHFYANDTWTYVHTPKTKSRRANFPGKGLLWADGDDHKRQRRSLAPAFSTAATRQLSPIFYDSAYKAKCAWDALIESSSEDGTLIEVQSWMNHVSLDTIGLAGFSYNFGALEGQHATITEVFDTFSASPGSSALNKGLLLLAEFFPLLSRAPTARTRLMQKLGVTIEEIYFTLLSRTQKEMEIDQPRGMKEKSIIGSLIEGARSNSAFHLTEEEVVAQIKMLLVAGYETTAISMTWALVELSRNPDVQTKLRNELLEFGADPTYDQITNDLPYLDAVVHEILRVHPPVSELTRLAAEDDVIPLSTPVHTKSGELVDSLTIAKGTLVAVSMESINRSVAIWGEDAKVFRPSRWLEDAVSGQSGIPAKAREVQGYRHLLTFVDGPRVCLGKYFAMAEFKIVLTVLVKHFVFELRDGVDSKIEIGRGVLPRPKVAGEVGCKLPLRVRSYVP